MPENSPALFASSGTLRFSLTNKILMSSFIPINLYFTYERQVRCRKTTIQAFELTSECFRQDFSCLPLLPRRLRLRPCRGQSPNSSRSTPELSSLTLTSCDEGSPELKLRRRAFVQLLPLRLCDGKAFRSQAQPRLRGHQSLHFSRHVRKIRRRAENYCVC